MNNLQKRTNQQFQNFMSDGESIAHLSNNQIGTGLYNEKNYHQESFERNHDLNKLNMNQVGNDHLAFNSIVTPNHNREFFRDDHNKSIKSNEGFFEMDNIFGSRDNSEDKEKQFFGIPLKQKNKYQDSINLNKMDDGGYYNNHKSSNNIDNFRMSPNMPGLTNFDNNPQQQQPSSKMNINDAPFQKNNFMGNMMNQPQPVFQQLPQQMQPQPINNYQFYQYQQPGLPQQQMGMKFSENVSQQIQDGPMSLKEIQQLTKQSNMQQNNIITKQLKKSNKFVQEQTPMTIEQIQQQQLLHQQQMSKMGAQRGSKSTHQKSLNQPANNQQVQNQNKIQPKEQLKPPKRSQTQDKFDLINETPEKNEMPNAFRNVEAKEAKVVFVNKPSRNDSKSEKAIVTIPPESSRNVPASDINATSHNNTNTIGQNTHKSLKVKISFNKEEKPKEPSLIQPKPVANKPQNPVPSVSKIKISENTPNANSQKKKKHIISFNLKKDESSPQAKLQASPKKETLDKFKIPESVHNLSQNQSNKDLGSQSPSKKQTFVSISLKQRTEVSNKIHLPQQLADITSNHGISINMVSQKLDGQSDSRDMTFNSQKADLGKEMKKSIKDTASLHVLKQVRSNSLIQKDDKGKAKNSNLGQKSNKHSNVKSSNQQKSNSSRLKVSIDFSGKKKDSVKVEEKQVEFLAPTQVKKVTRRITNNSLREKEVIDNNNQSIKGQPSQQENQLIKFTINQQQLMANHQQPLQSSSLLNEKESPLNQNLSKSVKDLVKCQSKLNPPQSQDFQVTKQQNDPKKKDGEAETRAKELNDQVYRQKIQGLEGSSLQQLMNSVASSTQKVNPQQDFSKGMPLMLQIQPPTMQTLQQNQTQPADEEMNDEVNSNFAQDSSMKSNKFQFQEKSQASISQKSTSMKEVLSSMKDVRNKERQEWKQNLMAKQPVRVQPQIEEEQGDLPSQEIMQSKIMMFYNTSQINQLILMQKFMMKPSQQMIQNLYLTLISQAAENGSNNSNFDINEQDKNCEFLHFNKPLSEVDSKQEESAFQNLNIINNQNYIQVTQNQAELWYQSRLQQANYELNLNIYKALQLVFQIQKDKIASLNIDYSSYVFYSDLLKIQILKMDHLQLQNEFNYHCKEYVTDYLKSQSQQNQVQTDHLIFLQRKFTIQEIYDEMMGRHQQFTNQTILKQLDAEEEEQKFERENIQFKQAQQIFQQFQSILPKNVPTLSCNEASSSNLLNSIIVKNVGNAQRLATMIKILQEKKPIEPNQNNADENMGFESFVQPSSHNSQQLPVTQDQAKSKRTLKIDLQKTVNVLEQMMKLLGDTSNVARKSKQTFENDQDQFSKQKTKEVQALEQPITSQQQHILLNQLKNLELLGPQNQKNLRDYRVLPYQQEIIHNFTKSIEVNLKYLMVIAKTQAQKIHSNVQSMQALSQEKGAQNVQKRQEKAKSMSKHKTDLIDHKLLSCEIKQFFGKYKSLFEQLLEISRDLETGTQYSKLDLSQFDFLKIQSLLEVQSKPQPQPPKQKESSEILPIQPEEPGQLPKKRQRKPKGAKNDITQVVTAESQTKKTRARRNSKKGKQQSSEPSIKSDKMKLKFQKQDSSLQYPSDLSPNQKIFQIEKVVRNEESMNFPLQLQLQIINNLKLSEVNNQTNRTLWEDMVNFNKGQSSAVIQPTKNEQSSVCTNTVVQKKESEGPVNQDAVLNPESILDQKKSLMFDKASKAKKKSESPPKVSQVSNKVEEDLYQDEPYFLNEDLIPQGKLRETRSRKCKEKSKQPSKEPPGKPKQASKPASAIKTNEQKAKEQQGLTLQRLNQEEPLKKDQTEKKQVTEQNESGQNLNNGKNKKKRGNKKRELTEIDNESTIKNRSQNKVQKTENIEQIEDVVQQIMKKPPGRPKKKQNTGEPKSDLQATVQPNTGKDIVIPKSPKPTQRAAAVKSSIAIQQGIMSQESHVCHHEITLDPNQRYNLVQCERYPSFEQQPYRIYFTFEVQMLMYIHAYLSKNEVIGLLGGISYDTNIHIAGHEGVVKNLVITKIYTADSCINNSGGRQKNCEISDDEQIKILAQMDKDKVQKLAWYHSHPIFEVDPSMQDLCTHQSQQNNFSREGKPFFGVIVGPYCKSQDVSETQIMVFNLKEPSSKSKNALRTTISNLKDRARRFQFKVLSNSKLKYTTYSDIKKMIQFSANHKIDKPEMNADWSKRRGNFGVKYQFKEKFMLSLKKLCEDNLAFQNQNLTKEIMDTLITQEDKESLGNQLTSQDVCASKQLLQQQNQIHANVQRLQNLQTVTPEMEQALQSQIQYDYAQFQQQLQIHTSSKFFSIGDAKKIIKFLTKIEQALIKEFKLNSENQMEQTYKNQKDEDDQNEDQALKSDARPPNQLTITPVSNRGQAAQQSENVLPKTELQIITTNMMPTNNQMGQGVQRNIEEIDQGENTENNNLKSFYENQPQNQSQTH